MGKEPSDLSALTPALWRLIGLQGLMNASHFMAMPLLALHCATTLGMSPTDVGAVLALYFLAARVTPVVVAPLADRFGLWPAVVGGLVLRGLGFLGLAFAPSATGAMVFSAALGLGTSVYEAGAYGIIGAQPAARRDRLIVVNAQALNLGCVAGPLAGAGLAVLDLSLPLVLSGLLFVALAGAAALERAEELRNHARQDVAGSYRAVFGDRAFLVLCLALMPWWALFAQLFAAFPLEATLRGGSAGWAGSVLVVNGALGFLILFAVPPLMRITGALGLLVLSLAVGGAAMALVGVIPGLIALLVLVGLFTCAEIAVLAGSEILVGRHADGRAVATYFALFNMSWGFGGALGGAMGPLVASGANSGTGWMLLGAGCGAASLVGLALYGHLIRRAPPAAAEAPAG